jgi:hypothetical protein
MEETQANPVQESKPKRPTLLTVLCILTFIGSGMNFFSSLMISLFYDQFTVVAESINKSLRMPGLEMILEGRPAFFAFSALIFAGSALGAILMWNLKKAGFHVYTIFQIILVISPMFFFNLPRPSFQDMIFPGIFIILYSTNLKYMS